MPWLSNSDTVVFAGHSEDTIQRRLCKCPLLLLESRCVQATCLIKACDVVHPPNHADRPALGELDEDLGHPHALACQRRHGVMLWIALQPLEEGVPQPDNPAFVVNDEPAAADSHRSLSRPQLAASGRSLRSQSVPCQFEMRPSAWQRGQCQTMAPSWASAAWTVPFLHLKHRGSVAPVSSKSVA